MFFGSRTRRNLGGGASPLGDPARSEAGAFRTPQWLAWRRSAQKVTRTWNEWLAAEGVEGDSLYRRYMAALGEEEQAAAELQHMNVDAGADSERAWIATGVYAARRYDPEGS